MSVLEGFDELIKMDNEFHLERFKCVPPSAQYISGFIDGDGCIFIRKIRDGFQTGIQFSQSRINILLILKYHFGGNITQSHTKRTNDNPNLRNQYNLIVRSNEYFGLLNYIYHHIIIKNEQIKSLMEISNYVNKPNKLEEKTELYNRCSQANKNKIFNEFHMVKMNIDYISGLFDAEGCLYINKNNLNKFYISITQKSHPSILTCIQNYLGFGNIDYTEGKLKIYSKEKCLIFINLIEDNLIVKYNQTKYFKKYLLSNDNDIKYKMYEKCNIEKHCNENFNVENYPMLKNNNYENLTNIHNIKKNINNQIKNRLI